MTATANTLVMAAANVYATASMTAFSVRNYALPSARFVSLDTSEPRAMLVQLESREMWVVPEEVREIGPRLPSDL
jgi:hypothetical protein